MVTLSSNVLGGYNANEIVGKVKELIKDVDVPTGYEIKMGGEQEDQQETASFLGFAFLASIGLIFMVLVTQFNSLSKPFIIFSTILLSLIGVLTGFTVFGMSYSIVMTGVGIVALAGIVVKNGILLIEFIEELRKRGYEVKDAIIEAGATRIIPVILTAGATVLGLIPLAFGSNINFATLFNKFYAAIEEQNKRDFGRTLKGVFEVPQEAGIIINNGEFDHELKVRRDGRNEQSSQRCT
jgi:multidrug efflux pump subunit AcrB